MKTAISIPDDLFAQAEAAARKLSISRSEICAKAVRAFIEARTEQDTTLRLNEVYGHASSSLDPTLVAMQSASLPKEGW